PLFFSLLRPPPPSTLFPTRRSSDLHLLSCARPHPPRASPRPAARGRARRVQLRPPGGGRPQPVARDPRRRRGSGERHQPPGRARSEEHTSELQSRSDLVCRLLLEKK